ncbi:MAG: hypothetical protein ACRBBJ_05115 [Rhodomicrobiaceae bacterium]
MFHLETESTVQIMFELKSHYDQPKKAKMLVELVMDDGSSIKGRIEVPVDGGLACILNGLNQFIELYTYDNEIHYISKDSLRSLRPVQVPEKESLPNKLKNFLRTDPHQVLGVDKEADSEAISAAYQRQLKNFHEILDYLDTSYKGLNSAYKQLEGKMEMLPPPVPEK